MNKEILYMVKSLSNEKGVKESVIYEAIEEALAAVAARRYTEEVAIRVAIDPETGEHEAFRYWDVVADELEELELPDQQYRLSDAKEAFSSTDIEVGDTVEEQIESPDFGRIDSQQAKHIIIQKVREAERAKIIESYRSRIGELLMGPVKRVTREFLVLDMGENAEALLPREAMIGREVFRMNDRVRVVLVDVREEPRGPQLLTSRIAADFLRELFKIEVPEIGEEVIEIRGVARDPGARAKIAVKTNDGRIDPIGACVGMRGSRVQAVTNELNGERVDIVLWDQNSAQLVINAMAPAEVASIVVDEDAHSMDIAVTEDQLAQAIGRGGQNIRLASELTGWKLNVMSEKDAAEKHESEAARIRQLLVEKLDIDVALADALIAEGFTAVQAIAYADAKELKQVRGFDADMAEEVQGRANDFLFIEDLEEGGGAEAAEDLLSLEGITAELAATLAKAGVVTRDDLAEQSVDELQDILDIDTESAGKLIMKAREHWFADE